MGFETKDPSKNEFMLTGPFRRKGYDWWWHSFTGMIAFGTAVMVWEESGFTGSRRAGRC